MTLYREDKIRPFNPLRFDASELSNAFKTSAAKGRRAKIVISMEDDESLIKVSDPDALKSYVLILKIGLTTQIR